MTNLEKVEKLIEKANITYEEAAAVLESCDWDMLDAIIKLENEGRIKASENVASHSTENTSEKVTDSPQQIAESYQTYQQEQQNKSGCTWQKIKKGIKNLFRKTCDNKFVVCRKGENLMVMPVLVLIILLLASVWTILIVMAIGLFFGFSYHFAGPDLGRKDINDAMAKANDVADGIKNEFHHE